MTIVALIILVVIIAIIAVKSIKVVNQSEVLIVERLGQFNKLAKAGLTIIIPFIDVVRAKISLKKQIMDIAPQEVITADNVSIKIDTVVFYQITDPIKAVYEIQSLRSGIENLAISAIRDIIGKLELDETFSSRALINENLRKVLDDSTYDWGCKVEKVEIQEIKIPDEIKISMEKQMNAERNKRALLLEAEGNRQSAITIAEGKKQALILEAEAEKEAKIKKAEGEAEAIKAISEAEAQKITQVYKSIKDSNPDENLIKLESLKTLNEVAKGEANKIFIPFDVSNTLSSIGTMSEAFKDQRGEIIQKNKNNKNKK